MRKWHLFLILFSGILFGGCNLHKDFALLDSKDEWSHHFAFGSPSWDTFKRFPNNPVFQGRDGMEWPVNGFLFNDPVSKNWYLFIGEYRRNYGIVRDSMSSNFNCVIYKSSDRGKSWEKRGNLFPVNVKCYDSLRIQAPDVMVVFDDGKYHLVFDWVSSNASWQEMGQTGIGYAVADQPDGPYTISEKPLKINSQYRKAPLLNKYWRMYAQMLVKRKNDWVLLYMMDTAPPRSWALAASTAPRPEGPYSDPVLIRNVEGKNSYPPLMEYFPAFEHKGYIYFPATSVATNRNFQLVSRVKTEDVTNPDQWEIFSNGAFWHSENTTNEYAGIWGQTFTGFVDDSDSLVVMYPSKNKQNYGTINLAKPSWNHRDRERGFALSACEGGSFTFLKRGIDLNDLNMDFTLSGTMRLVWDFNKPLDIQDTWGKFSFERDEGNYKMIEISETGWKIKLNNNGNIQLLDSGKVLNMNKTGNNLHFGKVNGLFSLSLNKKELWKGLLDNHPGVIGIMLDPHSNLFASRFEIDGNQTRAALFYGYYEPLLNSGNQDKDWEFKKDTLFRNGKGAISRAKNAFAKWNFEGTRVEIYLPRGPEFGSLAIFIDGQPVGSVNLRNDKLLKSTVVFRSKTLNKGTHSVYLKTTDGRLPLDCIEVSF
jgi:hypothetical protein